MRVGSSIGHRLRLRSVEEERAETLLGPRRDDHPVGGVAVEHERLLTGEHPGRALAPGAGADAVDGIAVTQLLERDGAAQRPGGERSEQIDRAEAARGERREHRRREERARERDAPHLLEHHDHVDEAEPETALLLGDQEPRPAERR